jgi:hypothetical protein
MSIYAIAAAIAGVGIKVWTVLNRALDSSPLVCRHQYTTEVLSTDPLMIYINNFVSPEEIDLLLDFKSVICSPSDFMSFFNYLILTNINA